MIFQCYKRQLFLPHFKQRGFVFEFKLIAVHQRYEATAISIRKGLFKCTLVTADKKLYKKVTQNVKGNQGHFHVEFSPN